MSLIPDIELSQVLGQDTKSTAYLQLKESADVSLSIKHNNPDQLPSETSQVTTTATECSWNLYATAKLPKPAHVSNRARLVDTSSDGQIIRVGSAIFVLQSGSSSQSLKSFTPSKFSLYVDKIEQHGQHLFVTSRQHVTEIPEVKDEPAKDADTKAKDEKSGIEDAKKGTEAIEKASATPEDGTTKAKADEEKKDDSSDDDDPSDKIPEPESDDSSSELSADESWSEASTEYDSDQQVAEFRPVRPPQERIKSISDSDSSSDPEDQESSASDDSEDENNLIEGKDKDEGGRYMDTDEESEMYETMFVTDRIDPASDADDQSSDAGFEDDDFPDWADWSDGDGFQAMGSDSEECSECGDDGGACALPPKDDAVPTPAADKNEDLEEPVGSPVSQIYIYDLSQVTKTDESELTPLRLFHFKRATQQTLADSPPAIHPTKSLVVWPIGDNRIIFADYISNTYFVRKFQTSQFWSSHVSINCRFSQDGKYLHVAAVEKSGKPPVLPRRVKKGKSKAETKKDKEKDAQKPKEEKPKYELIVSTYRMSESKTTRVPPVLIGRVQRDLGELDVLPTVSWTGSHVYVSSARKTTCHVYRADLGCPPTSKSKRSKQGKMTMQCFTAGIPEWAVGRELRFLPGDDKTGEAQLIVAAEATKIPPFKPAPKEPEKPITSETSKAAPSVDETPSTASTSVKPEVNGTTPSDTESAKDGDKDSQTDIPKTPEPQSTAQPTQNGSEHTETTTDKKEEAVTSASTSTHAEPETKPADTEKSSTPALVEPKPNPYPKTMTTNVSPETIKSFGGWRDILHATVVMDTDVHAVVNGDVKNGTSDSVSNGTDANGVENLQTLSFRSVHE